LQNPHQVVVYIVSGTGISSLFWGQETALRGSSGACNNFHRHGLPALDGHPGRACGKM
jgi:hypothetical protein